MKPGMRMLMVARGREGNQGGNRGNDYGRSEGRRDYGQSNYPQNEYNGARNEYGGYGGRSAYNEYEGSRMEMNGAGMNWEADSRFRDRRGREHYDNGRFAPMRGSMDDMEDNYGMESRRYSRREDGRFAPRNEMRMNYGEHGGSWGESHYPFGPVPPVYERGGGMNQIGFSMRNGEFRQDYPNNAAYSHMNEMEHRSTNPMMGRASGENMKLTHEMAEEWMEGLQNEDGTKGPHWTMDQVKQVMNQRGVKLEPMEFWVILNALYADYCGVLKKHGVNNMDFYVDLATAWLKDKDAQEGKAARYFQYIVK